MRALRKNVWHVLGREEKGLLYAVTHSMDTVQNRKLARILVRILGKLSKAMESMIGRVQLEGRTVAAKLSGIAVSWGNQDAAEWLEDPGYHLALGLGVLFHP
jgi:hypothetical protein